MSDPQPPEGVVLYLADGTKIEDPPMVYAGMKAGDHVWEICLPVGTPVPGLGMSMDRLPEHTAIEIAWVEERP